MTAPNLIWPAKPLCHRPHFMLGDGQPEESWREPRKRRNFESSTVETFRTCSYCGSIHPEDFYNVVLNGARVCGSDWKYGWPHKFYIQGIPNPIARTPVSQYAYCGDPAKLTEGVEPAEATDNGGYRRKLGEYPAPDFISAKWYNQHLFDLKDDFTFKLINEIILKHAGIAFYIEGEQLMYRAPYTGYQAS